MTVIVILCLLGDCNCVQNVFNLLYAWKQQSRGISYTEVEQPYKSREKELVLERMIEACAMTAREVGDIYVYSCLEYIQWSLLPFPCKIQSYILSTDIRCCHSCFIHFHRTISNSGSWRSCCAQCRNMEGVYDSQGPPIQPEFTIHNFHVIMQLVKIDIIQPNHSEYQVPYNQECAQST